MTNASVAAWATFRRALPVVVCFTLLACSGVPVSDADLLADPGPAAEDDELGLEPALEVNEARDEFNGHHHYWGYHHHGHYHHSGYHHHGHHHHGEHHHHGSHHHH